MEVTRAQPPPASPQRTASQATLGSHCPSVQSEKSTLEPSASPLLLRRASCRDYTVTEEKTPIFKRTGSLLEISSFKNRSNSFRKVESTVTDQISSDRAILPEECTEQGGRKGVENLVCNKYGNETKRVIDRGLFLNFDNFKEALFGDSKVLTSRKTGESLFSMSKQTTGSNLKRNSPEKDKTRKEILMQQKAKTPPKDEFTEFSQYGSRFLLNQAGEKNKKTNLIEQFQENKLFKKVVKKQSQSRESSTMVHEVEKTVNKHSILTKTDDKQAKQDTIIHAIEPEAPTALPRSKRDKSNQQSLSLAKPAGEPEKFNTKYMEKKSAMLFKKAEQPHSISMNTNPVPWHSTICEAAKASSSRGSIKLRGFSTKSDSDSGFDAESVGEIKIKQVDIHAEYDLVQLIGEGWFSRVYLAEHRHTRDEVVLKAINSNLVTADEFCREYHSSTQLWPHKNILKVYDAVFQCDGYYMFAMEYAPLGDLTTNITEHGLGEIYTKRVTCQVGSALQWIHSKNLCHMDVKLDNILVFRSDFSLVKLCDFGSVKPSGDIVIKKNELLPYCPAELVAKHANEYYQVDRVQDVFQFGIVVFFCLLGVLPWQKADRTDPHFAQFSGWREKRTSKVPRNFKLMTSRAQKLFRKLLDPDPSKRLDLVELAKYIEDKWLRKGVEKVEGKDGQSQLTLGSFQSVHSNLCEKNCLLYTLLQHGVETTVDRSSKNNRIIKWIKQGAERSGSNSLQEDDIEEEPSDSMKEEDDLDDIDIDRISPTD